MTEAQRLQIRSSEIREKLNTLAGVEELDDAQRQEIDTLTAEYGTVEARWRAATVAEGDPVETATETVDAEARERIELRGRASVGEYIAARLQGRLPGGALAEYGAACGARAGEIPIDLWEGDRPVEMRADAPSAAPSTVGVNIGPIHPYVFAASIAPRLGVTMPTVTSGTYSELRITTPTTAGPREKGTGRDSTAAVLGAVSTKPRSISARLTLRAEDILEIGTPQFEPALRANLSMALANAYDDQALNGDGTGSNVKGLAKQLTAPTAPTDVADFDAFLKAVAAQVDGTWARSLADVATVVPPDVYRLSVQTFRDGGTDHKGDVAASSYLTRETAGWWTAARLPVAPDSGAGANVAHGIAYRRGQSLTVAVHPVWSSISISDPYTDSASATHHFTAHLFVGDTVMITQPDAYAKVAYKVA